MQGPRGTTPSSVVTERRLYVGPLYVADVYEQPMITIRSGNKSASGNTSGFTQIDFTGIYDAGSLGPIPGVLDDAFVSIPMSGMAFSFFGTKYSTNLYWNSNNALVFGTPFPANIVSISATTCKSILLGNYDRLCTGLHYLHTNTDVSSITTLLVSFSNYYTDTPQTPPSYTYQIRLIQETTGDQRQFVEVCVITSPPTSGYDSSGTVYPSGVDANGHPIDSSGQRIDPTKTSPYNITNGVAFLNPCGTTFSSASPTAGTSFVFASDSTGTHWSFHANSYVNV